MYAIAIDSPGALPINARVNPPPLSEITGRERRPDGGGGTDADGLLAATAHIAEELNNQYRLGLFSSPKSADGKFHSIRVSMRDPSKCRVRARNGYVGTPVSKPR